MSKELTKTDSTNALKVAIRPSEITSQARRAIVAQKLLKGATKGEIIEYLQSEYPDKVPSFYITEYKQGLVFLYQTTEATKEQIRSTSLARLEQIFDELEESAELNQKDSVNARLKTIDLMNKTSGVYENENNVKVESDGSFTVQIGNSKLFDKQ